MHEHAWTLGTFSLGAQTKLGSIHPNPQFGFRGAGIKDYGKQFISYNGTFDIGTRSPTQFTSLNLRGTSGWLAQENKKVSLYGGATFDLNTERYETELNNFDRTNFSLAGTMGAFARLGEKSHLMVRGSRFGGVLLLGSSKYRRHPNGLFCICRSESSLVILNK